MSRVRQTVSFSAMLLWHSKHELIHLLLGCLWLACLSYLEVDIKDRYIFLALLGSLLPDGEHFIIHLIRKKKTPYGMAVLQFFKAREFRMLIHYIEQNHKTQSFLPFHHIGTFIFFAVITIVAFQFDRFSSFAFFGALALHYLFDMVDDFIYLRRLNPNWTRGLSKR